MWACAARGRGCHAECGSSALIDAEAVLSNTSACVMRALTGRFMSFVRCATLIRPATYTMRAPPKGHQSTNTD